MPARLIVLVETADRRKQKSARDGERLEDMAKILILTSPGANVRDSFRGQWQDFLAREAETTPGLTRIVYNRATPVELRPISTSGRIEWRDVTELWFDGWSDAAAAAAWLRTADVLNGVQAEWLPVEDRLMADTGERPLHVKVMVIWKRRPDLSRQEAQDYWAGPHVPFGFDQLGLRQYLLRYYQNHVVDRDGFAPASSDGASEFWVRDDEAFAAMGSDHDTLRQVAEDETKFMAPDGSDMLILAETELYRRDQAAAPWVAA